MINLGKDINQLDRYLEHIISASKSQRLLFLDNHNIILKRPEYLRYSKKYLKRYKIGIFKIFKKYIVFKF